MEQFALMFVGIMTLHHGIDLIRRKRIHTYEWAVYGLSILALAVLILAPGNYVRVDTKGEIMPPFIDNAWTLVYQNTTSTVSIPYILMLSMAATKREGDLSSHRMVINLIVLVGCLISPVLDKAIFDVVLIMLLAWQIVMMLVRERLAHGVWFLIFVGLGSQVMLMISAIWGFRCMLSMYMVYMLLIGGVLYHMDQETRDYVLTAGLLMSVHAALTLVFCSILLVRKKAWNSLMRKVLPRMICCLTIFTLIGIQIGYARNVSVHQQNLRETAAMQDNTIIITELPDDTYSWYFVPIGEFHEEYYRVFHKIPDSVEIIYQELHE